MRKVDMNDDQKAERIGRLWWPYVFPHDTLIPWADEAKNEANKMPRPADKAAGDKFLKWIESSLGEEGRDSHAYVRNEGKEGTSIRTAEGWTTNVMEVLDNHTKYWKDKWRSDDPKQVQRAAKAIKELRAKIKAGEYKQREQDIKDYEPDEIRRAARGFKGNTSIGCDNWTFK